jgi:transcriptional regulator with XRE-family HTH domain
MYYDTIEIGKRIQGLRQAKGITQEQLAENINISLRHLQKVERGERGGSVETLVEIALFFGTSLDFLILGKTQIVEMQSQLQEMAARLENMANTL